jgi:hypothetical protein
MPGTVVGSLISIAWGYVGLAAAYLGVSTFTFVVGVVSFASAIASFVMQPDMPDLGSMGAADRAKDRLRNVKQPLSPHRVIYGKTRVGGTITYLHTTDDDEEMHQLVTVAGHPVDAIESIYGDDSLLQYDSDNLVNNDDAKDGDGNVIDKASKWSDFMYVWSADGTTVGDSDLLDAMVEHTDGSWTDSHKQEGLAKVYNRFLYDRDAYASSLPNITVIVRGKKVYDPRDSRTVFTPSPYNVDTAINSLIDEVSLILLGQVGDQVLNDLLTETDGDYERGDVNNDGSITADDKTALENYLSTSETEPSEDESSWIATKLIAHMRSNTKYSVYFSKSIYSNNSALCILDYIKDARYGVGEPESSIDIDSFITAANISDEFIQLKNYALIDAVDIEDGKEYIITTVGTTDFTEYGASANTLNTIFTASFEDEEVGSGTGVVALSEFVEKRYVCNGTFETSAKPSRIMKDLLSTCSGRLTYQGGKWALRVGAYVSPTITFTEDDLESGLEIVSQVGRRNLFNQAQSVYTSPQDLYQPTDAPLVKNAVYLEQDQDEVITRDMEFPFTTAASTSQRLAKIELERVRQQITVATTFSLKKGMQIQAGDTIGMTNERMGWVNKSFIVEEWGMNHSDDAENPRLIVGVALREIASGVFNWNSGEETTVDTAPNTNLPDPFNVRQPTGLSVVEELYYSSGGISGSGAKVRAIVSWVSASKFVHEYEVQFKKSTELEYTFATVSKTSPAPVSDLDSGVYDFRVRGINSTGSLSAWSYAVHSLSGLTTAPADMTGFSVRALDGSAYLSWDAVNDLDVIHGGYILIRHSFATSGAIWASGVDIGKKLGGNVTDVVLPLLTGTYLAKAVDSTGNFSVNAVSSVTTVKNVNLFNYVVSLDEAAGGFAGVKTEMVVSGLNLRLGGAPFFIFQEDGSKILMQSGEALEREVQNTALVASEGTYVFNNYLDLGASYTSRVYSEFETSSTVVGDLFDNRTSDIDSWSFFDGEASDTVNAELQIRTTNDDPSSSPTWDSWRKLLVADFNARAFDFRVLATSSGGQYNIDISKLKVIVDMPDRVERGHDITSGSSTYSVTYAQAYYATPTVGITANSMGSTNHYVISNSNKTGFDINFYTGSGTGSPVSTNFNYQSIGY